MKEYIINENLVGYRLDKALKELIPEYSRAYISKCLEDGKIEEIFYCTDYIFHVSKVFVRVERFTCAQI